MDKLNLNIALNREKVINDITSFLAYFESK